MRREIRHLQAAVNLIERSQPHPHKAMAQTWIAHYYFQHYPMAYLRLSDPGVSVMGGDLQLQPALGQALRAKLVSRFFVASQLG